MIAPDRKKRRWQHHRNPAIAQMIVAIVLVLDVMESVRRAKNVWHAALDWGILLSAPNAMRSNMLSWP
jgi:hypothetical protein